jgi:uncharacterized phage protein (TIGR02216 family)
MLAFAVTVLRLSPEAFWRTGFREWFTLHLGLAPRGARMQPCDLAALMDRFPD